MQVQKAIGGYFELELMQGQEYHQEAIRLNSGRNALEYILRLRKYKKVFIPFYTCDAVLTPINRLGLDYEFYAINQNFEPLFDFEKVEEGDAFLYTNYFGLKEDYVQHLSGRNFNLIIDNAQAFYAQPLMPVSNDTFYSARKFFGVPDGAYLYANKKLTFELEKDSSIERMEHLLLRHEKTAEDGYAIFSGNEEKLGNAPLQQMSRLTESLLCAINYAEAAEKRRKNFMYLHNNLNPDNQLQLPAIKNQVPMIYPFLSDKKDLRDKLISNRIFVPRYWPNVLQWAPENSLEKKWAENIIFLPIDQRYDKTDMDKIITIINSYS